MSHGFVKLSCFEKTSLPIEAYARVQTKGNHLHVLYEIRGQLSLIRFPKKVAQPSFVEGLWEETCFEIFLKSSESESYVEWNFSPNKNWAYFAFKKYRTRSQTTPLEPLKIDSRHEASLFSFSVEIPLDPKIDLYFPTIILEDVKSGKTHWAIKHPESQPDFHRSDFFEKIL